MNFTKNAVSSTKPPFFTGYGNDYMHQQPKKSISFLTLFIVVVCTFVLAFGLFKNFDRMTNRFSSSIETSTWFQLGQVLSLSGLLQSNGDLISYTHTLTIDDGSIFGLKSSSLDLSIYKGNVSIQGTIEKEFTSLFIIEVTVISWTVLDALITGASLWSWSGLYMSQAGIYFPPEFGQKYSVLNQWENGLLKVKNIATNQSISISYFVCKKSDPNKNCSQLQQNISAWAEKTVSTSRGDTLYKLEWISSWFLTNGNFYGYFINDVPEQEVIDIANAVIFPNDYYIQNNRLSKIQTLCTDGSTSLMQVVNHSLDMDLNGLIINLQWPTADGSAICKVFIDPSQAAGGTKISYVSNTPTLETGSTSIETTSTSLVNIDTSVSQFPINLEKTMTFTSSTRGYSIIFPSMNIAYEAINVDEGLDLPGVRCSTQMNVTKFSEKATLSDSPKIKIFTCTIKGTLNNLWNSIVQKTSPNGINFLIQIADPARAEFVNNLVIQ